MREVLRGAGNDNSHQVDGLTAEVLNKHYADISTDCAYRAPRSKHTAIGQISSITEMDTFRILNTLRPTATGLGQCASVVPANRSTGICCASCSATQPVYGRRSCAKSVENRGHHSDSQSTKANSSGGLQADFNKAGPFAVSRKVHRANVHLPSITTAIS